jgi:hypothetical protein
MESDMSRFDLEKTNKDPEEWGQLALQNVGNNGLQMHVFGGFALAATVAVMSNPLTGALVAGYVLFSAFEKGRNQQKNFDAVRKGCVAHVLDGGEFRAYVRQVGHETVMKELQYATEEEYEISDAALDYLEQVAPTGTQDIPRLAGFPAPELPQSQAPFMQSDASQYQVDYSIDIVKEITAPIRNCIIFGIGGSGKGVLVSNAIRKIKHDNPNRKIFYIDPKNEPGEYGYTEGHCDVIRRFTADGKSSAEICEFITTTLKEYQEWAQKQEESLLIIDEGSTLGDAAKKEKNTDIGTLILHIASLGGAKRKNMWLMAQSPFVSPLGLDLNTTSQIAAVCLVSSANTGVLKQWSRSPILEKITLEEMNRLIAESPVNRAVYFGGNSKWYAMPELTNYSDIDRDNNRPTGDALSKTERQELRDATSAAAVQAPPKTDNTEQLINKLSRSRQTSLEDFIAKDLKAPERIQELKPAIVSVLREAKRNDLLEAFNLGWLAINDPIAAMKHYAMDKDLNLEEIKEAWLLYTGQQLNDQGAQLLKNKINE